MKVFEDLEDPAILLGNGLNRHANKAHSNQGQYGSWAEILQLLANLSEANRGIDVAALSESSHITMPEIYSALEFRQAESVRDLLLQTVQVVFKDEPEALRRLSRLDGYRNIDLRNKSYIAELIRRWEPTESCHGAFFDYTSGFRGCGLPVLTTNYDTLLEKVGTLRGQFAKHDVQRRGSTKYLDKEYYASEPLSLSNGMNRFSIWHIHGNAEQPNTLKISNADYAKMLKHYQETARNVERSWLRIFFESDLVIIGFGFGPQEYPLRWLLMERMMKLRTQGGSKRTIYMCTRDIKDAGNRNFFFESIGVEVDDSASDYDELYGRFGCTAGQ